MAFVYIGSPYSHQDPAVRQRRYEEAMRFTVWCLSRKDWVYSPIVHCHEMAQLHNLPTDFEFWKHYNFALLEKARALYVLALNEWEKSKGLQAEIEFAMDIGLPILLTEWNGNHYDLSLKGL